MSRFCSEMNSSPADTFGGCFAAYMTSILLVFAGIAVAMSVVFFAGTAPAVRLCFALLFGEIVVFRVRIGAPAAFPMR